MPLTSFSYRGYFAVVNYDADEELLIGKVAGTKDQLTFHAEKVADLKPAFRDVIDSYLAACEKFGRSPDKAYSGKMMFRVAPEIHAAAAQAARGAKMSLNEWAQEKLRVAAEADLDGVVPA